MITSTSINAPFIAKLVHAANVAIACESYCEVFTSKGKSSVLVEWDVKTSSLRFTHVSGQDVSAICWEAIKDFVQLPVVNAQPEYSEDDQHDAYVFLSFYMLFLVLGLLSAFGIISWGMALAVGGLVVVGHKLLKAWKVSRMVDLENLSVVA